MTPTRFHVRLASSAALALIAASGRLAAQDSSRTHSMPQRAWLNVGAGLGPVNGADPRISNGLAGTISAVYSPGPLLFEARAAADEELFGDGVEDRSVLVGLRSPGQWAFASAAVGYAHARYTHSCDGPCGGTFTGPFRSAIAYEANAELNALIVGLGVTVFGVAGPARMRYTALALSVQLGKLR